MIKRLLLSIMLVVIMTLSAQAIGPTVSFMTEQLVSVDEGNSLSVELGYFLGVDSGLEPYIGTVWWPRWDEDNNIEPPSVVIVGVRNHFKDIVDPNSAIPFIPPMLLTLLNEDVEIKPYLMASTTINFIDKDDGVMALGTGILVRTSPDSNSALRFELRWNDTFGQLSTVPDNRFDAYMGIYIPF